MPKALSSNTWFTILNRGILSVTTTSFNDPFNIHFLRTVIYSCDGIRVMFECEHFLWNDRWLIFIGHSMLSKTSCVVCKEQAVSRSLLLPGSRSWLSGSCARFRRRDWWGVMIAYSTMMLSARHENPTLNMGQAVCSMRRSASSYGHLSNAQL